MSRCQYFGNKKRYCRANKKFYRSSGCNDAPALLKQCPCGVNEKTAMGKQQVTVHAQAEVHDNNDSNGNAFKYGRRILIFHGHLPVREKVLCGNSILTRAVRCPPFPKQPENLFFRLLFLKPNQEI
jgi:hypothetical protein